MHGASLGPDGRIYWFAGRFPHEIRRPGGPLVHKGTAPLLLRARADGSELEVVCGAQGNGVGVAFTVEGDAFACGTFLAPDSMGAGLRDALIHCVDGGEYPVRDRVLNEHRRTGDLLPPLAHLGVAVFIAGVTLVKGYEVERDVKMAPGDTVVLGSTTFRFEGVSDRTGPNYRAARGVFDVSRNGRSIEKLFPEKRVYNAQGMPMTEAAIDSGPFGDLYVSLGEPVDAEGKAWAVRVYLKPFVTWIWGGCMLMALGGLIALSDRRYRIAREPRAAAAAVPAAP